MREFRGATRAVMSNARCLTEGVDVPAVDMVAFLSPRRSRVDIVQATGRAMRRAAGKERGYVLVPLYVEMAAGESVEVAVSRADFDEVWDVLQSLQEQDEALAELIRHFGETKGRGKGFDDRGFADRIDFGGPRLSLENLRTAVTTRCLENLYSSFDSWFGKLKAFKERFGHCNLVQGWKEDPQLAAWTSAQRTRRRNGTLSDEQIERLNQLGFVWDYQKVKAQETWMKWYWELEAYVREHGNPHVPRTYSNKRLASWVWNQRQLRKGTFKSHGNVLVMTPEQERLLDKLGFRWDARADRWMESFESLKIFKAQHGHCKVGIEEAGDEELAGWVRLQRVRHSIEELPAERKALLDEIGFSWSNDAADRQWREMYDRLKQYHAEHGDADVPAKWKEDPKLATWVSNQRQRRKKGAISEEEVQLLNELGITWKSREVGTWEDRLAEVAAFKAKHGHCGISTIFPENPKLGRFVNSMRSKRNSGTLSADRIAKLDAVGFAWNSTHAAAVRVGEDGINGAWKARFDELLAYKQANGNCEEPARRGEKKELANWVSMQRQRKKRGQLHPERVRLLEEIGFIWEAGTAQKSWEGRYAELLHFKAVHGSCDVPARWPDNPPLSHWVINQRQYRRLGKLNPEYERLLNDAGFIWAKLNPRTR